MSGDQYCRPHQTQDRRNVVTPECSRKIRPIPPYSAHSSFLATYWACSHMKLLVKVGEPFHELRLHLFDGFLRNAHLLPLNLVHYARKPEVIGREGISLYSLLGNTSF